MDTIVTAFTSFGVVFMGLFVLFVGFVLFFLPFWTIVDASETKTENRVFCLFMLVFTWGIGSIIYGLFFAGSKALRKTTIIVTLIGLGLLTLSISSCGAGLALNSKQVAIKEAKEQEELKEQFKPLILDSSIVGEFYGLSRHIGTTLTLFTLNNEDISKSITVDQSINHLAKSTSELVFAIGNHNFGILNLKDGRLTSIQPPTELKNDFSWLSGIAFIEPENRVAILASHVYNHLFLYDHNSGAWKKSPGEWRGPSLAGLAYSQKENLLYSAKVERNSINSLLKVNLNGAEVGIVNLQNKVPLCSSEDYAQLNFKNDKIILIFRDTCEIRPFKVLAIDPTSGNIFKSETTKGTS